MSTPRTVRLSPNDNVVVAVDPIPEGASAAGVTAHARIMRGHKMAVAPIAQGRAGAQIRPDHRLCHGADRAGRVGAHAERRDARFRARLSIRRGREATTRCCRPNCARPSRAMCGRGQDRHAQLHRHSHLGELLGLRGALHRARGGALRRARRSSRNRRRGGVRARHRLRARGEGRGLRCAPAHAVGLRDARQPRRAP